MSPDSSPHRVTLDVDATCNVTEVVLGFRDSDGELCELAALSPPVTATLEK